MNKYNKLLYLQNIPAFLILTLFLTGCASTPVSKSTLLSVENQDPRKGKVAINLQNKDGEPLTNASINYTQTAHDFLFGVGMSGPQGVLPYKLYPDFAKIGVNYVAPLFL